MSKHKCDGRGWVWLVGVVSYLPLALNTLSTHICCSHDNELFLARDCLLAPQLHHFHGHHTLKPVQIMSVKPVRPVRLASHVHWPQQVFTEDSMHSSQ